MAETNGQDRSEAPTPRRRQEARDKGDVPRSREVPSAFILLAAAGALYALIPDIGLDVSHYMAQVAEWLREPDMSVEATGNILSTTGKLILAAIAPVLVTMAAISLGVGIVQGRATINSKALEPSIERLDPIKNIQQMFGWRAVINLLKQIGRLLVVGTVAYLVVKHDWPEIIGLAGRSPKVLGIVLLGLCVKLLAFTAGAYLLLAAADFAFEFWEYEKKLRMTKQEIRDEIKNTDGDPLVKHRIRGMMRALAQGKMINDVPKADVVIVNPTHRAVALRYQPEIDAAPVVLAMGEHKIALRIREIAEKHEVPIVEDRALAKALLRTATVGQPIPIELYQAVAEVLAHLYRARYGAVAPPGRARRPI